MHLQKLQGRNHFTLQAGKSRRADAIYAGVVYGPSSGMPINCIIKSIGLTYNMAHDIIKKIYDLSEKKTSCFQDRRGYVHTSSKEERLKTNGDDRTLFSRHCLPGGPGVAPLGRTP